jgi:hypothetical protein
MSWETEYKRRCLEAATGYTGDGDEPGISVEVYGSDGYYYSSYTYEDPNLYISVIGKLRDGTSVYHHVSGPEDVADFIRSITA